VKPNLLGRHRGEWLAAGSAPHRNFRAAASAIISALLPGRPRIPETNHGFGPFDGNGIEFATNLFPRMHIRSVFIAKDFGLGLMLAVLAGRRTTESVL